MKSNIPSFSIFQSKGFGILLKAACFALLVLVSSQSAQSQQLDVLVIGSTHSYSDGGESGVVHEKPFDPTVVVTRLQSILSQDSAISGTTNVEFEDVFKTKALTVPVGGGGSAWPMTFHCYSLMQHFMWPENKTTRMANLRGEGDHQWDYIVLCEDPYVMANFPGVYAEGVKMIQNEISKSANPAQLILLGQWPENSSTFTATEFNKIVHRIGDSGEIKVAPAAKAWASYGSQDATSAHPTPKGQYLAAAAIYSKMFNRSAKTSGYTYASDGDNIADHVLSEVQSAANTAQYTGKYTKANAFQMGYFKGRTIDWNEYGSSTEEGFANGLKAAFTAAKVSNVRRNPPASGDPVDLSYSRGTDAFEANKQYKVNAAQFNRVHGFPMGDHRGQADTEEGQLTMRYGIDKRFYGGFSFYNGTDLGIAYSMVREGEIPQNVRGMPVRLLWSKINHFQPTINSHRDGWHLSNELDRAVGAYLYTVMSGRCPVEAEPADTTSSAWKQWWCRKLGYETAWQMAHLTTRVPGFRVTPSSTSALTLNAGQTETMTVQFVYPPKHDVTVTVNVSSPTAAVVSSQTLTFTPSNYNIPQQLIVAALPGATSSEPFNVDFITSSNDEIYDALSDSWSYTTARSSTVTVNRVDAADIQVTAPLHTPTSFNIGIAGANASNTILLGPAHGSVVWSGNNLIEYTSDVAYLGSDEIRYVATIGNTQTIGFVKITVEESTAPPTANAGVNQTVTLGSWSPSELNPNAWYDASDATSITESGGLVSEWRDKSGNNSHAGQSTGANRPSTGSNTMGGLNVVTLNGSSQFFNVDLDYLAQSSHSSFVVTKTTSYSDIYGAADASAGANSLHVGFLNDQKFRMNYWGNDWNGNIGSSFNAGGGNVLNYIWTSGTSKQIFANGTSQGTSSSAGTIGTMSGGGRIGKVVNHSYYGGDIAEIVFITGALSASDREKMEGYLAHKWGLEDGLPAAHPYKSSAPGGNSQASAQVNLDGTVTGGSQSQPVSWSKVNGPGQVTFEDSSAVDTTATFTQPGTYVLRFTVGSGGDQTFDDVTINVQSPATVAVDFSSAPIEVYSPSQDGGGVATVHDSGAELRIVGNGWKRIAFPYNVTKDTILEFEFRSDVQAEIQGIGFDNDDVLSSNTAFQLYGTQTWGLQNYKNYTGSGWKTYRIRVGDYFVGSFTHLVFPMDHDGGARNGESFYRNVKVLEDTTGVKPVNFSLNPVLVYDSRQDGGATATLHEAGKELHIKGNGWKRIALPYNVTADTILEFEFKSAVQGEIHGIGFDNDDRTTAATNFQLYGSDSYGISNYKNYSGSEWKSYRIRVGDYFTGAFSHLVFPMDHDGGSRDGESFFRSIRVYEEGQVEGVLNFAPTEITPYDTRQDGGAVASVHSQGAEFQIKGNGWKKVALPYNVTADTILEFEFRSDVQGEIHGIGFDNDDYTSSATNFQLYGTQNYGISSFKDYSGTNWKSYQIRVGDYFTGSFTHLVFPMDHDGGARNGESYFRNVRIYEENQAEGVVDFAAAEITAYDSRQDGGAVASVHTRGEELRIKGNGWKKIELPYTVTANTILEFEFKSGVQGEIHGIGFDDDDLTTAATNFQLYGTHNYGISNFKNYTGTSWKSYQIRVGDYFTGSFNYLVFPMDHDGGARDGESFFRNVKVYEDSSVGSFSIELALEPSDLEQPRAGAPSSDEENSATSLAGFDKGGLAVVDTTGSNGVEKASEPKGYDVTIDTELGVYTVVYERPRNYLDRGYTYEVLGAENDGGEWQEIELVEPTVTQLDVNTEEVSYTIPFILGLHRFKVESNDPDIDSNASDL